MKKKYIYEIVFAFFLFLINWFKNDIVDHFGIVSLIALFIVGGISLVVLLYFIIKSLINIKNKTQKKENIISIFILLVSLFLYVTDFSLIKVKIEFNLYEDERKTIINDIKNNEYEYYLNKNIKLTKYKYVSSDGEVYVYENDKNQVITFWINRGMLSGSKQLIYTSSGIEGIYDNLNKNDIIKIKQIKKYWYYVEIK